MQSCSRPSWLESAGARREGPRGYCHRSSTRSRGQPAAPSNPRGDQASFRIRGRRIHRREWRRSRCPATRVAQSARTPKVTCGRFQSECGREWSCAPTRALLRSATSAAWSGQPYRQCHRVGPQTLACETKPTTARSAVARTPIQSSKKLHGLLLDWTVDRPLGPFILHRAQF